MSEKQQGRFVFIDGLRGLAALAVVLYHFDGAIKRTAENWIPGAVEALIRRGYLGVEVFFVISGFVIAYSIRDGKYTAGYLFRFWLRRLIRLDPPYWVTLTVEIALIAVGLWYLPELETRIPTLGDVGVHLLYAQSILGHPQILPIFWTLCYEVQFYVFVVALMTIWQSIKPSLRPSWRRGTPWLVLSVLFVYSVLVRYTPLAPPVHGLALDRWFQFFLGVLVWWTVAGKVSVKPLLVAWVFLAGVVLQTAQPIPEQSLGIVVSAALLVAARTGKLSVWLRARPLQFLGQISYSLYLLHLPIGWRFIALCQHAIGGPMSVLVAWIVVLGGVSVSLLAASLSYRLLEAPSMRLSKRIRLPSRKETPAPQVDAEVVGLATVTPTVTA